MEKAHRFLALFVLLLAACSSHGEDTAGGQSAIGAGRRPANVPLNYVATPNGYFDPSCVVRVASGEVAHPDGTLQAANGATRKSAACAKTRYDLAGRPVAAGSAGAALVSPASAKPATYDGWVEDYSTSSIGALSFLSSTWIVPQTPSAGDVGQTIYFFNGLEGLPQVESILQPVIAYEGGRWTAASWNCCASGTTFTGNTIDIHPGDVIVGTVTGTSCHTSSGLCDNWVIETRDQTTNQSSVLNTASWGRALNWVFPAVLEVYGVSACSDLPASGELTFSNQMYTTVSGSNGTTADWSLSAGGVDPDCSYGGQVNGASVTLDFTGAASGSGGGGGGGGTGGGGFSASCTGIALNGSVLTATCNDTSGRGVASTMNLDSCVTNNDGVAQFEVNGGYSASCSGCALSGSVLGCRCDDVSGQAQATSIDLNQGVSNCNGQLTCGGC
ncbi:MAG TPA: CVNH domain-containing protein [Polyangiaceae bacterium]|jgi:hypothetical protein